MVRFPGAAAVALLLFATASPAAQPSRPHNLVIFVADGLRSHIVDEKTAPDLAAVRAQGVDFRESHSLFPTITTPNASAIATGHRLGDTGDFGNVLWVETPFEPPFKTPVVPVEEDAVLGLLNERYGGDYLGSRSLVEAAANAGWSTAVIGKLGPAGVQAVRARDGRGTIVIDDLTGWRTPDSLSLSPEVAAAIRAAGLSPETPERGLNAAAGAYNMAGTQTPNVEQQDWMAAVAAKVLLPRFKAADKPFILVFWSRDPDGTQHNQGDSLGSLTPGILGPTTLAAVRNASHDLGELRKALSDLGLEETTDVFVTADHGFSVESHASATSDAAKRTYRDVKAGETPPGFLAIDLARRLRLGLFDATGLPIKLSDGFHPRGGALLARTPADPQLIVASNGGADLIYIPRSVAGASRKTLAVRTVEALTREDYVGSIFVDDEIGTIPGTLPMSLAGLVGSARTPRPAIVVSFRSFGTGCADPELCGAEAADTDLQTGQGIHGSSGRQDTHNFMAAIGPDFKAGFVDPAPISNADIAPTLARITGLDLDGEGGGMLKGRVISEAIRGAKDLPEVKPVLIRSAPAANGFVTVFKGRAIGDEIYLDAAGMPGRVIGLDP